MSGDNLLTCDDIAGLLRVDVGTVWGMIRRNKDVLQPFKVGREYRIERNRFEMFYELLKQGKTN